jgi:multicomponent K+:H+ antiporter subunit D
LAGRTAPALILILACVFLSVRAEPVLRHTRAAADALHAPGAYVEAVLSARPGPGPEREAAP